MSDDNPGGLSSSSAVASAGGSRRDWWLALLVALLILSALDWLLARILWLPFYSGLFGYLVAGLLAGALSFRIARKSRPLTKKRIAIGALIVAIPAVLVSVFWEYQYFSATVGNPPKFSEVRNVAIRAGRPPSSIGRQAQDRFKEEIARRFSPFGTIGYVRWAVTSGEMDLEVEGRTEKIIITPRGGVWIARTSVSLLLLAVGLWLSFDALRFAEPVSNIITPGEEYEEID